MFDRGLDLNLEAPKRDYLTHARRAALANSEALGAEPARGRHQKASLRGFSSLVLWTAAGAVAAALAGGVFYYTEQSATAPKPPTRDALNLPADGAPGSIAASAAKTESAAEPAAEAPPLSVTPAPVEAAPAEPAPTTRGAASPDISARPQPRATHIDRSCGARRSLGAISARAATLRRSQADASRRLTQARSRARLGHGAIPSGQSL